MKNRETWTKCSSNWLLPRKQRWCATHRVATMVCSLTNVTGNAFVRELDYRSEDDSEFGGLQACRISGDSAGCGWAGADRGHDHELARRLAEHVIWTVSSLPLARSSGSSHDRRNADVFCQGSLASFGSDVANVPSAFALRSWGIARSVEVRFEADLLLRSLYTPS